MHRRVVQAELTLRSPLHTGAGTLTAREVWVVEVADNGHRGFGEAAPLARWGSETGAQTEVALRRWEATGEFPGLEAPSARFAVSSALADLEARKAGKSLAAHLMGEAADHVDVQATAGDMPADALCAWVAEQARLGFTTVKLKVGARPVDEDLERIRRAREASALRFRLDANEAWSSPEATAFFEGIDDLDIDFVEQPLGVDELDDLVSLRRWRTGVALDESLHDPFLRERILRERLCDVLVLKPTLLGSLDEVRDIIAEAIGLGYRVVISSAIESAIGRAVLAHLSAASLPGEVAGLNTGVWLAADLATGSVGPRFSIVGPGIGISEIEEPDALA